MFLYSYIVARFGKVDVDRSYIQCMKPDHEVGRLVFLCHFINLFGIQILFNRKHVKNLYVYLLLDYHMFFKDVDNEGTSEMLSK